LSQNVSHIKGLSSWIQAPLAGFKKVYRNNNMQLFDLDLWEGQSLAQQLLYVSLPWLNAVKTEAQMKKLTAVLLLVGIVGMSLVGCSSPAKKAEIKEEPLAMSQAKTEAPVDLGAASSGRSR